LISEVVMTFMFLVIIRTDGRRLGAAQLWLFWVAPIAGALVAGVAYRWLAGER
jgi:glycerol uptake facilitator-like aquaporin